MKNIIFYIFLLFIALACQPPQSIRPLLEKADSLLVSHPDSAFLMLDTVSNPDKYAEDEYAEWCLLLTQARDKSYREHTSDSLTRIATDYYREHGPSLKYATALYTAGRVASELGKSDLAVKYYLEAEHVGRKTNDYRLLYLTTSHLARIYGHLHFEDSTLSVYKRALEYAKLSGNRLSIANAESYIGRAYSLKEKWDSAVLYYDRAVHILRETEYLTALAGILNERAIVAIGMRDWSLAKSCFQEIDSIPAKYRRRDQTQIDLNKAEYYYGIEEDSLSRDYFQRSMLSENIYTRRGSFYYLYLLEQRNGNCNEALKYVGSYLACLDSIAENVQEGKIAALPILHQNESIQERYDNLFLICCLGAVSFVLFISLLVCLCIIYRDRLQRHVLFIRNTIEYIKSLKSRIAQNKEVIQKMEALYNSLVAKTLNEKSFVEKQLNDFKGTIDRLKTENEKLNQKIAEQKKNYRLKNTVKGEEEIRKSVLLFDLKKNPIYIEKGQWPELFLTIDILFDNFTKRLTAAYPDLGYTDLQYCSLFKAGFSIQQIAVLLNVDSKSVSHRKIEIRKRMHLEGKVDVEKVCKKF